MKQILFSIMILLLISCSSDNNTPETNLPNIASNPAASANKVGSVNLFVTDALTDDYREVWVSIKQVKIIDDAGKKHSIFHGKPSQVFNLTELDGIGELLSTQSIPVGDYQQFEITLEREISLVTNEGVTEQRVFASSSNAVKILLDGELTVEEDGLISVAIDFDLDKFSIDDDGNVVPVVALVHNPMKELKQNIAKIKAEVVAVNDNSLTIKRLDSEIEIVIQITENTMLHSDQDIVNEIMVGDIVKIYGAFDSTETVLDVYRISVIHHVVEELPVANDEVSDEAPVEMDEDAAHQEDVTQNDGTAGPEDMTQPDGRTTVAEHSELEGIVISFSADEIVVDVKRANFMPESDLVTIQISDATRFLRGMPDMLKVEQTIFVSGLMENGILIANIVEIEGAGKGKHAKEKFVKVAAEVISQIDDELIVKVLKIEGIVFEGLEMTLNISSAQYKNGSKSMLTVGAKIVLKGTLDDNDTFNLVIICLHDAEDKPEMVKMFVEVIEVSDQSLLVLVLKTSPNGEVTVDSEITLFISDDTHFADDEKPMVGDTLRVHAIQIDDELTATNIVVQQPSMTQNAGTVSAIDEMSISIELMTDGPGSAQMTYEITAETEFVEEVMPVVGDIIRIKGYESDTGFIATRIVVRMHPTDPTPEFVELRGTILSISDDQLSLETDEAVVDILMTDDTQFIDDLIPEVGDDVELKAESESGVLTAIKIGVIKNIPEFQVFKFRGVVIEITDVSITVENRTGNFFGNERSFKINTDTVFVDKNKPEMGDTVKILAEETELGDVALEIVVKKMKPVTLKARGIVIEITDTLITIESRTGEVNGNEQSFIIDALTEFNSGVIPELFNKVVITGVETAAGYLATKVEVLQIIIIDPPMPVVQYFFGKIASATDVSLTIDLFDFGPMAMSVTLESITINLDDHTVFADEYVPVEGDYAGIIAAENSDGMLALNIMHHQRVPPIISVDRFDELVRVQGVVVAISDLKITFTVTESASDNINIGSDFTAVIDNETIIGHPDALFVSTYMTFSEGDEVNLLLGFVADEVFVVRITNAAGK